MANSQIEVSRAFYVAMRKATGCPPIVCSKFGDDEYYVETKDGKVHIESLTGVNNSWDAKAHCIEKWVETQRGKDGQKRTK
jgi:hypothetical protein